MIYYSRKVMFCVFMICCVFDHTANISFVYLGDNSFMFPRMQYSQIKLHTSSDEMKQSFPPCSAFTAGVSIPVGQILLFIMSLVVLILN